MEKLTRKELELILELLQKEKERIHQKAIRDAGAIRGDIIHCLSCFMSPVEQEYT